MPAGLMIAVRVQPPLLAKIDAWRKRQPDRPTRPEALRRLAEQALDHRCDQHFVKGKEDERQQE